jgi:Domain of unknown function (DUF4124)
MQGNIRVVAAVHLKAMKLRPSTLHSMVRAAGLGLVVLGSLAAEAADASIYKCAQDNGAVLYTEYPCKGGSEVEMHPSRPDPAAADRLARIRAELERSAARRQAREEVTALRRQEIALRQAEIEAMQSAAVPPYPDVAYGPVYGAYGAFTPGRPFRARPFARSQHQPFDVRDSLGAKPRFRHSGSVPAQVNRPHRQR